MNRHYRFARGLGEFRVNLGTVSEKYAPKIQSVTSTLDTVPKFRDGPLVNLIQLSAAVEKMFTDALAFANPNLLPLDKMNGQQRVDFFKRLQWYFKENQPPYLFATLIDRAVPFAIDFFGKEIMMVTNQPGNDWAYEYNPVSIPLRASALDSALGAGQFGTSSGSLTENAKAVKAMIHDALTQTVWAFRDPVAALRHDGADAWAPDQAAWSFVAQFGQRLGVDPPPVYPYISESGSDNFVRNAANREIWRANVLKRGDALLAGIDPKAVEITAYLPFDAPKKGSEYYANLLGTVATAGFMAWGATAVIGQLIPNNYTWLQNQWQTRIVQPLQNAVTNPLGAVKEAIAQPLSTVKSVIADPVGAAQTAATEYVQKKVASVIGPYGRVLEIVVDPAGFIKDKISNEVLYPLQNPGEWLIDEARQQIRNKVTGEIRDLVTGALLSQVTPPQPTATAATPTPTPDTVAATQPASESKPFPWRLALTAAAILWGAS